MNIKSQLKKHPTLLLASAVLVAVPAISIAATHQKSVVTSNVTTPATVLSQTAAPVEVTDRASYTLEERIANSANLSRLQGIANEFYFSRKGDQVFLNVDPLRSQSVARILYSVIDKVKIILWSVVNEFSYPHLDALSLIPAPFAPSAEVLGQNLAAGINIGFYFNWISLPIHSSALQQIDNMELVFEYAGDYDALYHVPGELTDGWIVARDRINPFNLLTTVDLSALNNLESQNRLAFYTGSATAPEFNFNVSAAALSTTYNGALFSFAFADAPTQLYDLASFTALARANGNSSVNRGVVVSVQAYGTNVLADSATSNVHFFTKQYTLHSLSWTSPVTNTGIDYIGLTGTTFIPELHVNDAPSNLTYQFRFVNNQGLFIPYALRQESGWYSAAVLAQILTSPVTNLIYTGNGEYKYRVDAIEVRAVDLTTNLTVAKRNIWSARNSFLRVDTYNSDFIYA